MRPDFSSFLPNPADERYSIPLGNSNRRVQHCLSKPSNECRCQLDHREFSCSNMQNVLPISPSIGLWINKQLSRWFNPGQNWARVVWTIHSLLWTQLKIDLASSPLTSLYFPKLHFLTKLIL